MPPGRRTRWRGRSLLASGFSKALLLEAITIVAASTITNYTGSITNPPLEAHLQQ
jgi:hypothetical protein